MVARNEVHGGATGRMDGEPERACSHVLYAENARLSDINRACQKGLPSLISLAQSVTNMPTENSTCQDDPDAPTSTPVDRPTPSHTRSPPPGTLNMSDLRNTLPDINFNSPSTNIIGTPFAHTASNTPFEYPFPESSPDNAPSPSPPHLFHRPGSPHGNFQHPPHPHPQADGHPSSSGGFNLFHSKFKAASPNSPPPMPPSLRKKRWTLNILSRKRTSNPPTPTTECASSPLGSPPAAPSGAVLGGLGSGRPRLGDRSASGGIRSSEDSGKSPDK